MGFTRTLGIIKSRVVVNVNVLATGDKAALRWLAWIDNQRAHY
jgi:hypothetical protein